VASRRAKEEEQRIATENENKLSEDIRNLAVIMKNGNDNIDGMSLALAESVVENVKKVRGNAVYPAGLAAAKIGSPNTVSKMLDDFVDRIAAVENGIGTAESNINGLNATINEQCDAEKFMITDRFDQDSLGRGLWNAFSPARMEKVVVAASDDELPQNATVRISGQVYCAEDEGNQPYTITTTYTLTGATTTHTEYYKTFHVRLKKDTRQLEAEVNRLNTQITDLQKQKVDLVRGFVPSYKEIDVNTTIDDAIQKQAVKTTASSSFAAAPAPMNEPVSPQAAAPVEPVPSPKPEPENSEAIVPSSNLDNELNPNNLSGVIPDGEKAKVHLNKGRQLEVAGDHQGAIGEYRLAAATDGDLAWAWGEMSYSLNKLEKYQYGIIAARKCIDIGGADKMLGACYFDLGFAQEMLGNKAKAISAYEKSLENRPGHDYVMKRLADLRGGQ
jgi:hypothetical protein